MKKILSIAMVMLLSLSLAACGSGTKASDKPKGTLVVGVPKMNGDFINGFGNSSYDNWVRKMIYGYGTYAVTDGGEFVLDQTVVKEVKTDVDATGNKTYTFTINKDLKWSDGEKVTAQDYVFGVLFDASKAWVDAGATTSTGDSLVGYKEFHEGTTDVFAGVKLVDEYTFSLTIAAEQLPYFYETSFVSVGPSPLHDWAKDVKVESTDAGSKLVGDLAAAANYVAGTYRYKPTVCSGPFKFESFENDAATVVVNENYKGDYRGEKGKLEKVILKYVNATVDVDLVISGDIDLVAGVIEGEKIEKAKASETADFVYYARNGYGMIAFHNDFAPTNDANVRKAIAYLIDRNQFVQNVLGGYGTVTNGEYGLSQWMYQAKKAEIEEKLVNYTYNPEKANQLLDQTQWKFEKDGKTPFDATKATVGSEYYRYNEKGEVLATNHLGTVDNPVTDTVQVELSKGAPLAGIKFTLEMGDFNKLLDNYYGGPKLGAERKYHSFNLATGFTAVYDPFYSMNSKFLGTDYNPTQTSDPEMDRLQEAMRKLDPSQKEEYANLWLEYQVRWNDVLPVIPIYSNQYYDVFNKRVQGLQTTPVHDWADDITDITVTE